MGTRVERHVRLAVDELDFWLDNCADFQKQLLLTFSDCLRVVWGEGESRLGEAAVNEFGMAL
ncbi:hypothetical protein, partial [Streptomyces sp. NPDC005732]|uniref:hypothetical protein n=1 Tax=Streptomyces sp. NPDC005732 TaxID=3157057 RepID=UPI0033E6FA11